MKRFVSLVALMTLLALATETASAQYYGASSSSYYGYRSTVASYHNPYNSAGRIRATSRGSHRSQRPATRPSGGSASGTTRTKGGGTSAPSNASGSTTFQPVASSILPRRLALSSGGTPAEQQEAERFFNKVLSSYKELLRQKGAPSNDVARAASFMIISSHAAYTGRELSNEEADALRAQMREVFSGDPQFQRKSNREKQEIYESYAIIGMYLGAVFDGASKAGDRNVLAEVRELARKQLEETFGAPAAQIAFTAQGVEYR